MCLLGSVLQRLIVVLRADILALFPILGQKHSAYIIEHTVSGTIFVDLLIFFLNILASVFLRAISVLF